MINQITNYLKIDKNISTSGQLSASDIASISKSGFKTVINLGLNSESYSLSNEAELVQILGMKYIHIPVEFNKPRKEEFEEFEMEMNMVKPSKVFIHCAANKRVSIFMALYLMKEYGWNKSDVNTMVHKIWFPNECWLKFFSSIANTELSLR